MTTIQMKLPVITNENGDPIGLIFHDSARKRVIYLVKEPSEEELIELLETKDAK